MSKDQLPIGTELCHFGQNMPPAEVEEILERNRPRHGQISRSAAVFVSESASSSRNGLPYSGGHLHEVEVSEPATRHDNGWIGELQRRHHPNSAIRTSIRPFPGTDGLTDDEIAQKYWVGDPSGKPSWEILCPSATVIT